jgi:type IV secretion system protein VirB9
VLLINKELLNREALGRMNKLVFFISTLSILCFPVFSYALQESRPLPGDSRLRVITYNPNGIHHYIGYYDYQASILFEKGEEVQTLSMGGDPTMWQIVPSGNRMFIKPVADNPEDAKTNVLLVTNKRVYHFIFEAAMVGPEGINDPNLVFETKFVYPDAVGTDIVKQYSTKSKDVPDLSEPEKYNFNYTISGNEEIAPLRVFDDGQFTFFQFNKTNAEIPAFFMVDSEKKEALVNYRAVEDYIIIERVISQFTLRHGNDVACVFNESKPLKLLPKKK